MRHTRRILQWMTCALVVMLGVLAAAPQSALAHNTLESTDPPDGAVLAVAPSQIVFDFSAAVPLDTSTVQVVDPTGTRTEASLSHDPAGPDRLVAALGPLQPGAITVRWRLVGPDGHPLTGRVNFTITPRAAGPTTPAPTSTPPAVAAQPPPPSPPPSAPSEVTDEGGDTEFSVPSAQRWLLRYASYLAVMTVIGVVLTDRYVWPGASQRPVLRQAMQGALIAIAGLAAAQLLVLTSDIAGRSPWSSFGSLDAALGTGAGMAMAVRLLLAGGLWLLLFHTTTVDEEVRDSALALGGVAMLGTWAWAGHSATQRWPEIGFPFDVAHHAAAALWISALVIVGVIATARLDPDQLTSVVRRLSTTASISVAVIVVTGIVQSSRLVGNPAQLFDADHGKYLAIKLVAVGAMLIAASVNRRRVQAGLGHTSVVTSASVPQLRRTILVEFALGLVVIGVTSALVVSPPATAAAALPAQGDPSTSNTHHYTL